MNIPFVKEFDEDALIEFMKNDKKASGNKIDIVLVDTLGEAYLKKVSIDELRKYLRW